MSKKINNVDLQILSLFTKSYYKTYYIREVERLLKISSRTALINLAKLEQQGILKSKTRGKIKLYSINESNLSKEYFILTEQYKKIQFLNANLLIGELLEKCKPFVRGLLVVFGSYSKGTQKENSDLDLLIVGTYDQSKIKYFEKIYGIDINIKHYPKNIFKKELNKDILLKEVVDNHIIITGIELFVEEVKEWIK